jgi:hypothetical protein
MVQRDFEVDAFLARPLTARLATTGPKVRPVWYLWEEERFWVLTGPWNKIADDVEADPRVALVVDTCDLTAGECLQVLARGTGVFRPYDPERGLRKLSRYLGPDPAAWDARFRGYLQDQPATRWLEIVPTLLIAKDLSFSPPSI